MESGPRAGSLPTRPSLRNGRPALPGNSLTHKRIASRRYVERGRRTGGRRGDADRRGTV